MPYVTKKEGAVPASAGNTAALIGDTLAWRTLDRAVATISECVVLPM
jgi:hypothetical protein